MNIYNYMNQKLTARLNGKETGISFPYLTKIKKYWIGLGHKWSEACLKTR